MVLILGLLGLRTGTVIAIDVEHVDRDAGLIWFTEKGRRQRQVVVPEMLNKLLGLYISQHHPGSGPLFLSSRKKRISPRILQDIFRTVVESLDINKRLHAHLFRHTAATHLNKVAGTTITQAVLGHQRRYNTLKYAHLNPDIYATPLYSGGAIMKALIELYKKDRLEVAVFAPKTVDTYLSSITSFCDFSYETCQLSPIDAQGKHL